MDSKEYEFYNEIKDWDFSKINYIEEVYSSWDLYEILNSIAKKEDRKNLIDNLKKEDFCVNKLINNAGVIIEGDLLKFSDEEIANAVAQDLAKVIENAQK